MVRKATFCMNKPYDLPSLTDLSCFEVAARHRSFKRAATELNVTPAAVSHRIKALEQELGQPLFTRRFRGVELTEAGALLFVALQRGFTGISDIVTRIRSRHVRSGVSIAATTAMSTMWLMPRLAAFWQSYPEIAISQAVQDGQVPEGVDLSIHYGNPDPQDDETIILFRDRILALGSTRLAERHGIRRLEDLVRVPLVHTRSDSGDWTGWQHWFDHLGAAPPQGASFVLNNYLVSLKAAEDHMGAVLGWEGLLGSYLETGRLVQLVPEAMPSPFPFYLRIHGRASANAKLLADWLASNIELT